jgi:hypothetical protein
MTALFKEKREAPGDTRETDTRQPGAESIGTDAIAQAREPGTKEVAGAAQRKEADGSALSPLFSDEAERELRTQWQGIQTGFVDEPRRTVEQADKLVAQVMQQLAQSFSDQRSGLERQWEQSDRVSTEDLRLALRRYRSFFERLLSI